MHKAGDIFGNTVIFGQTGEAEKTGFADKKNIIHLEYFVGESHTALFMLEISQVENLMNVSH